VRIFSSNKTTISRVAFKREMGRGSFQHEFQETLSLCLFTACTLVGIGRLWQRLSQRGDSAVANAHTQPHHAHANSFAYAHGNSNAYAGHGYAQPLCLWRD
jgi:hypothetical protein